MKQLAFITNMEKEYKDSNKTELEQMEISDHHPDEAVLAQAEMRLSTLLFRLHCPEPEELLNYQWGLLEEDQVGRIVTHLAECPHCLKEANQLAPPLQPALGETTSVAPTTSDTDLLHKIGLFVGRLMPQNLAVGVVRSDMSQLGGQSSDIHVYTVEELNWDITLSQWSERNESYKLQGQVLGASSEQIQAFKMGLIHKETLVTTTTLNEAGVFSFPSVPSGNYTLYLFTEQVKVFVPDIHLP